MIACVDRWRAHHLETAHQGHNIHTGRAVDRLYLTRQRRGAVAVLTAVRVPERHVGGLLWSGRRALGVQRVLWRRSFASFYRRKSEITGCALDKPTVADDVSSTPHQLFAKQVLLYR